MNHREHCAAAVNSIFAGAACGKSNRRLALAWRQREQAKIINGVAKSGNSGCGVALYRQRRAMPYGFGGVKA